MNIAGYIVECDRHGAMLLSDGQLYFGSHVTLFSSRDRAKAAIKRTIEGRYETYGKDFEQEFGKLRIRRVVLST